MSRPNGPNVTKIEEAFLYVAPVHAGVVRDARAAVQELVEEVDKWHREALDWQQAKSEADSDADDARQEAHRLSETITDLERALAPADALADTYGRVWAQHERNSDPLNVAVTKFGGACTSPPSDNGNTSSDDPHPGQLTIEDGSSRGSLSGCSDSPTGGSTCPG